MRFVVETWSRFRDVRRNLFGRYGHRNRQTLNNGHMLYVVAASIVTWLGPWSRIVKPRQMTIQAAKP